MRRLAAWLLICVLVVSAIAATKVERVSIQRMEKILSESKSASEQIVLNSLKGVELNERVSSQELRQWKEMLPDESSRRAITALGDASVFLNPPAGEIPKTAPLEKEMQQQVLARVKVYVDTTMEKMPNFFANESVTTFQAIEGLRNNANVIEHQPMHYVGVVSANLHYRDGKEVIETNNREMKEAEQVGYRLLFSGQFGPVLNTVLADAQLGKLSFSYWEPGAGGPMAVFKYSVSRRKSHCRIKVVMPGSQFPINAQPGYHGEIAVNPTSGTIGRLTLISDLNHDDPMSVANLMVEYGPVELGGQTYICPIRSVTLETVNGADSNRPATVTTQRVGEGPTRDNGMIYASTQDDVPTETLLNDVVFDHYQILRSDMRMITGDEQKDEQKN